MMKNIDEYGIKIYSKNELSDVLYNGLDINNLVSEDIEQFNKNMNMFDKDCRLSNYIKPDDMKQFDIDHQKWFLEETYEKLDIFEFLLNKCTTKLEIDRVVEELEYYTKYEMIDMLKMLVQLVDHFRNNEIIWGVGRGSSISSYVLFLIGVHKINSLKHNLSITEFFRG